MHRCRTPEVPAFQKDGPRPFLKGPAPENLIRVDAVRRYDERNVSTVACVANEDVRQCPTPMQDDDVGIFDPVRTPRGTRLSPRNRCFRATVSVPWGRRPADIASVDEPENVDVQSRQCLTPASAGVGRPRLGSLELGLIMNDLQSVVSRTTTHLSSGG